MADLETNPPYVPDVPMRVLVIEDDRKVASFIQTGLAQEGYSVDVLNDGEEAGEQAHAIDYDAVVLDLMLPGRSGFQVLRDIRARKVSLPVLILTARDSLDERVAGLDAGADDYMTKPFALAELSARLRALLRRGAARENVLRVADLEMDTIHRKVRRAGAAIELKPKEYALLEFLMRNADRPLTKSLIIEHVWDIHFDSVSNVVEVHINSLRNKIDKGFGELIKLGLVEDTPYTVFGAQATGCSPVAQAFRDGHDVVRPVRPDTIAKSLAIGNPADGPYVLDIVRRTGGVVGDVGDEEVVAGIQLLARTEGIFTETAGGTTVANLKKFVDTGALDPDAETVIINSGDGLKTLDAVADRVGPKATIPPTYEAFVKAGLQ